MAISQISFAPQAQPPVVIIDYAGPTPTLWVRESDKSISGIQKLIIFALGIFSFSSMCLLACTANNCSDQNRSTVCLCSSQLKKGAIIGEIMSAAFLLIVFSVYCAKKSK